MGCCFLHEMTNPKGKRIHSEKGVGSNMGAQEEPA